MLLVLLDDLSLERVGTYGVRDDAIPMPTFDALAAQGVLFRHAWAEPLCSPTRAALLTGRHPRRTGIGNLVDAWRQDVDLSPDEVLIPEMLARSAWEWDTSMAGKWHVASSHEGDVLQDPREQGFRWWAGSTGNLEDPYQDYLGRERGYFGWFKNDNGQMFRADTYATTDTAADLSITNISELLWTGGGDSAWGFSIVDLDWAVETDQDQAGQR